MISKTIVYTFSKNYNFCNISVNFVGATLYLPLCFIKLRKNSDAIKDSGIHATLTVTIES